MCHKKTELCVACRFDAAAKITMCKDAPKDIHKCKNFEEELVEGNNIAQLALIMFPAGFHHVPGSKTVAWQDQRMSGAGVLS